MVLRVALRLDILFLNRVFAFAPDAHVCPGPLLLSAVRPRGPRPLLMQVTDPPRLTFI